MSTLVLARKYRPRDFDSLVGQPHVVQAIANALTQRRLHHAYLFTGTRGVGKTTISRILAKSLNCTGADGQGGITARPCGVCVACQEIDSGRYIDYVELDAASNRGVDEISQLLDQSVYKPVVGRFKVYMIDEVHMLSNHAFNAMLKSLEEPPEYLKFVLATTDPQKVPPTVLSRCLQFNLRPLAPQTVHEHLDSVLRQEGIDAEPAALALIARAARGSMRDALSLTDQAIAHGAGSVDEGGVRQMLGAVDRAHAVRLVEALAVRDGASVITAIDQLRELGLSAAGTLEEMAGLLQQAAVLQVVPDAIDRDDPDAGDAVRLAGLLASDESQLLYSIVLHGRAELALAPDEYSGLVMVLLRFLAFPPNDGKAAGRAEPPVSTPRTSLRDKTAPAPVAAAPGAARTPAASTQPASRSSSSAATAPTSNTSSNGLLPSRRSGDATPPSAPLRQAAVMESVGSRSAKESRSDKEPPRWIDAPDDAVAPQAPARRTEIPQPARDANAVDGVAPYLPTGDEAQRFADRWTEAVRRMVDAGSIGALARELALQAQCIAIDDSVTPMLWHLRVERETLRAPAHGEKLQAALQVLVDRPVRIEVEGGVVTDSPALREAAERARRQAEAEQAIENDPLVRALMSQYKTARIVPGSVKSL
jgi:DNA polymerase-3 subunit gamma/tau